MSVNIGSGWKIALRVLWKILSWERSVKSKFGPPETRQVPGIGTMAMGSICVPIDKITLSKGTFTFHGTAGTEVEGRMEGAWEIRGPDGSLIWRSRGGRYFGVKTTSSTWNLTYSLEVLNASSEHTGDAMSWREVP